MIYVPNLGSQGVLVTIGGATEASGAFSLGTSIIKIGLSDSRTNRIASPNGSSEHL